MHQIEKAELGLSGTIYGSAPVQAHGKINGCSFYFRSRWDEWTFAISEHAEIDPVDIQLPEWGEQYGYFAAGQYGTEFDDAASYMDVKEAEEIIIQCTVDYLKRGKPIITISFTPQISHSQ